MLSGAVTLLLALLMFAVSLTFDVAALRVVLRRPGRQLLATVLVYVPMSLAAVATATAVFGSGPLWLGMILLGVLRPSPGSRTARGSRDASDGSSRSCPRPAR